MPIVDEEEVYRFNRTFMELKYKKNLDDYEVQFRFNRTFMELKCAVLDAVSKKDAVV